MPKASVIIPAYNTAEYIEQTLDSILTQSYSDFEIIIIDDGSTDETADKIKAYTDPRVRYYYQANSGRPSGPRNKAINLARGDVIFIFDSDDVMLPDKIKASMEALDAAPEAGMVFTGFCCVDEGNTVINPSFLGNYHTLNNLPKSAVMRDAWLIRSSEVSAGLAYSNFVGTSGVAVRRRVFDKVGFFDTDVRNADDKLMWSAIADQYDFIYIPTVYHQYRVRKGSISLRNIAERADGIITVLRKMKEYDLPRHCYKELDRQISRKYFEQGYDYFRRYEFLRARESFKKSFSIRPGKDSLWYGLLSLLPIAMVKKLKHCKSAIRV